VNSIRGPEVEMQKDELLNRIVTDAEICGGQPWIRGTPILGFDDP